MCEGMIQEKNVRTVVSKRRVLYMCIDTQWGCPADESSSIVLSKKRRRVFGFE